MKVNHFLLILIVSQWGFAQTPEVASGNLQTVVTESRVLLDSLGGTSRQLDVSEVHHLESQLTEPPLTTKPISLIAVVSKYPSLAAATFDLNVDSLICGEINRYQLAKLDLHSPFETQPIEVVKADTTFANYVDSLGIDQLLVWELSGTKSDLNCELELLNSGNYTVTKHATISLGVDREFNQQRIREGVWQIFEQTPPPGLFPSKIDTQKSLFSWFTSSPKRSALAAVSTAVLVWFVIQNSESDLPTSGIGQPPNWPQN